MCYKLGDTGYNSFISLYKSYILSVANYGVGVWRFKDYPAPRVLQNKISRFYLGVHRFAPVPATSIEMNIPNIQFTRWLEMLRYHNRIANLNDDRLPRIVYNHDVNVGRKSWVHEVENIARILHLPPPSLEHLYDLETVEAAIIKYSQNGWWNAAEGKAKLRTYISFKTCLSQNFW